MSKLTSVVFICGTILTVFVLALMIGAGIGYSIDGKLVFASGPAAGGDTLVASGPAAGGDTLVASGPAAGGDTLVA